MPPSFAANPLSTILRSNSPEPPSDDPSPSPLTPRSLLQRKRLPAVRLPRTPTVPSLNLRRASSLNIPWSAISMSSPSPSASASSASAADHYTPPHSPTELLVLSHGLQGAVEDFTYLLDQLRATPAAKSGRLLVHPSRVNTDKTHDGIVLGGLRLSEDIRAVVAEYNTLKCISLMGFSLGGLYVRYAAGHLYDPDTGRIAGLQARKLIVVASPNLGVRSFGVYRFLPDPVLPMAVPFLNETITQLLLRDDEHLLMAMTTDRNKHGMRFLSALGAFSERWIYANVRNDFMVNYGTAALDHTVRMMDADAEQVVREKQATMGAGAVTVKERVDDGYDEKGCRICFQLRYEGGEEESGSGGGMNEEEVMSKRLKKMGWTVVGVDFPLAMPIAHNKIVAMSRNAIHTWINAGGRRVVHHLVDTFSCGFIEHEQRFRQVRSSNGGE